MSELKKGLFGDSRQPPLNDPADKVDALDHGINGDDEFADSVESALSRREQRRQRRRERTRLTLSVLPTMLTLGNGVCGMAAIAVATSGNLPWEDNTKLLVAGILIFGGMVFDALDGSAARLTGAESEFGAQLDSLCDAITFGAAPAVLVWRFANGEALPPKLVWAIGVLFALCVLIRLARFNVETEEDDTHEGFEGLPSPAAAGTLAAFAIAMPELDSYHEPENMEYYSQATLWLVDQTIAASQYFVPIMALMLAYLMVSRFQYPHIFQRLIRGRRAPHQIGQGLFVIIGVALLHWLALPIAFLYYALAAPLTQNRWVRRRWPQKST